VVVASDETRSAIEAGVQIEPADKASRRFEGSAI